MEPKTTIALDIPETAAERNRLAADDAMQFFAYDHLPVALQAASKPFGDLATWIVEALPRCPQRTIALNKLLEAKDAAVRAARSK